MSNYPQYPNTPGPNNGQGGNNPYGAPANTPSQGFGAGQPYGSQPGGAPQSQPYGSQPAGSYGQQQQAQYGNSFASQSFGGGMPAGFGQPGPDGTVPLNQPWYGIGFMDAIKRFFKKYVRFNGFASRGEYWWAMLGIFVIQFVLAIPYGIGLGMAAAASESGNTGLATFGGILGFLCGALMFLFAIGIALPAIAVSIRRLHDAGFSGWFYLLSLVPIGNLVVIILMFLPPNPEKWQPTWYDQEA